MRHLKVLNGGFGSEKSDMKYVILALMVNLHIVTAKQLNTFLKFKMLLKMVSTFMDICTTVRNQQCIMNCSQQINESLKSGIRTSDHSL
jgi:hypothetical protein